MIKNNYVTRFICGGKVPDLYLQFRIAVFRQVSATQILCWTIVWYAFYILGLI